MPQKKALRALDAIAGEFSSYLVSSGTPNDYPLAAEINKKLLPKLMQLAVDENPMTRGTVISILGAIGTDAEKILPVLKNAISDPEPFAGGEDASYALEMFERNQKRTKTKPKKTVANKPKNTKPNP